MHNLSSDHWYLRKHEDKTIFGPVSFTKLQEWARSAQISPHDEVSSDKITWTKAPMIPELEMDWLVQVDQNLYYGPTTASTLLEFYSLNEISPQTVVINCKTGHECPLSECEFFPEDEAEDEKSGLGKSSMRAALQRRVRELEAELLEKQRRLLFAEDAVRRLERRVAELENKST
jgi:hypothetical protein